MKTETSSLYTKSSSATTFIVKNIWSTWCWLTTNQTQKQKKHKTRSQIIQGIFPLVYVRTWCSYSIRNNYICCNEFPVHCINCDYILERVAEWLRRWTWDQWSGIQFPQSWSMPHTQWPKSKSENLMFFCVLHLKYQPNRHQNSMGYFSGHDLSAHKISLKSAC